LDTELKNRPTFFSNEIRQNTDELVIDDLNPPQIRPKSELVSILYSDFFFSLICKIIQITHLILTTLHVNIYLFTF
jgi:hypothetical protein